MLNKNNNGDTIQNMNNLKMTNPNLASNLRNNLSNIVGGGSTSASTNGASGQHILGKSNKQRKGIVNQNSNHNLSLKRKGSITTVNGTNL